MTENRHRIFGTRNAVPELSEEAAERILHNVLRECGMPPNTIPLKVLAEKYGTERKKETENG